MKENNKKLKEEANIANKTKNDHLRLYYRSLFIDIILLTTSLIIITTLLLTEHIIQGVVLTIITLALFLGKRIRIIFPGGSVNIDSDKGRNNRKGES